MPSSAETAVNLFQNGASCAQAVLTACAPQFGISEAAAMRMGSGMGAGMTGLREICGAVSAMVAVLGLKYGSDQPMEAETKAALYAKIREAVAAFDAAFGTHNCKELLQKAAIKKEAGVAPEARTAAYYAERPCAAFVKFCADYIATH